MAKIIKLYKYNQKIRLANVFSDLIIKLILDNNINYNDFTFTYIPSNNKINFIRGFRTIESIIKSMRNYLNFEYISLYKNESKKRHAELSNEERKLKKYNNLKVINKIPKNLIIIDDVYTTGSTIKNAYDLISQDTQKIIIITLARAKI